jgi:hypothetical protein
MAALQGLAEVKTLVEIDHEVHFAADRFTNSLNGADVVGEALAAGTQLQALETAFVA